MPGVRVPQGPPHEPVSAPGSRRRLDRLHGAVVPVPAVRVVPARPWGRPDGGLDLLGRRRGREALLDARESRMTLKVLGALLGRDDQVRVSAESAAPARAVAVVERIVAGPPAVGTVLLAH